MESAISPFPTFLGVAQRAFQQRLGWNFEGVSTLVFAPFFPQSLDGLQLLFAFPFAMANSESTISIVLHPQQRSEDIVRIELTGTSATEITHQEILSRLASPAFQAAKLSSGVETAIGTVATSGSKYLLLPIRCPSALIYAPDTIQVAVVMNGQRHEIGSFDFGFLRTPPLSQDEVRELAQRGSTVAYVRAECRICGDSANIYASLLSTDLPGNLPEPRISIRTMAHDWSCKCGKTTVPVKFLRPGIHELFRLRFAPGEEPMRFLSYYEQSSIAKVISEYSKAIYSVPDEEQVQKFLEENQILWCFLGPLQIIPKPRVLSRKVGDFAILSATKTLYLVEIEKPQTVLTKQMGGQSAEIQKGLDQINQWRLTVHDHRLALLDELGIHRESVHEIKYILIGGLTTATDSEELRALRQSMPADTTFYAFDELARMLGSYMQVSSTA